MLKLFNFSNRPIRCISHLTRNYKTQVRPDPLTATNSENTYEKCTTSRLRKYFEEHELTSIVKQAPESYLKRSQIVNYCTVVNPKLAKRIAFSICSRLEDGFVIESDPGFGFMSRVFVSVVPRLFLCERSGDFRSKLEDLKNYESVHMTDFNVCTLLKMILFVEEVPLTRVTDFYQDILSKRNADDSQKINWIFTSLTKRSLRQLCFINLCDSTFKQLGKMTYFITLPSKLCKILSEPINRELGARRAFVAALFQVIFDYEVLMTDIPRKMFLPWPTKRDTDEELILIRAAPKENLETLFESELLARSFLKFLEIGFKKGQRIIPLLEKYVDNCGPLLILEHDLTVYTELMELPAEKILSVFLSFSKLPEFSYSTFVDDAPDGYADEAEASEKKLNDEVDHFEDASDSEDDEESQLEENKANENSEKNSEHF